MVQDLEGRLGREARLRVTAEEALARERGITADLNKVIAQLTEEKEYDGVSDADG